MFKDKYTRSYLFKKFQLSSTRQSNTKKIISSILAILVALLIATTIAFIVSCRQWEKKDYAINYSNIWITIFTHSFGLDPNISATDRLKTTNVVLSMMGILIVSGLAFIVAFKAGLFNMGVSGQMFAGAAAATIVGHKCLLPSGASQVVMLFVSISVAAFVAIVIGVMKVFLNVNEVVSSIMLNWFIYFIAIMILSKTMPADSAHLNSANLLPSNSFWINQQQETAFILILIFAIICVIFVSIFLKFTVIGKKQIATGLNPTAAHASGYNDKLNLIGAMAISGVLAGILGCMVYCSLSTQMPITAAAKSIPQEGFNGIAVGLIAMNNPIACVPIAFFFALIQESATGLISIGIDANIPMVVFGIVVYGSAAIALFMNIKPYWLTIKIFKGKNYSIVRHNHNLTKLIFIDISSEQIMLLNKKYSSFHKLTTYNRGTLPIPLINRIQIFFATVKNKIYYWWLKKVKKMSINQLRKNDHLNQLQNARINHTTRVALIKTNIIQKEAYEKTSKWFEEQFNIKNISSKPELKAIKQIFYVAFNATNEEIDKFYEQAYKVLKKDRHYSLDKLNIRFNEALITKIYFAEIKKRLKKINMASIFAIPSHQKKTPRYFKKENVNKSQNLLMQNLG